MTTDGTPLPPALDGTTVTRTVVIDAALLFLVVGALSYLVDNEPLVETGALTTADVRNLLGEMLYSFITDF